MQAADTRGGQDLGQDLDDVVRQRQRRAFGQDSRLRNGLRSSFLDQNTLMGMSSSMKIVLICGCLVTPFEDLVTILLRNSGIALPGRAFILDLEIRFPSSIHTTGS